MASAMQSAFLQHHRIRISTLSAVHIGCGEDYEPTNYIVSDGMLHGFDTAVLAEVLDKPGKKRLNDILDQRDPVIGLQAMINELKEQLLAFTTHSVDLAPEVVTHYESRVGKLTNQRSGDSQSRNALQIQRTAFNPHTQLPLIPGSSIKGAIRTALLNNRNGGDRQDIDHRQNKKLEKQLLEGAFETDPLRLVKIGDAVPSISNNQLLRQVLFESNIKRISTNKERESPASFLREVLPTGNYGMFDASITLQQLPAISDVSEKLSAKMPGKRFTLDQLVAACNDFYGKLLQQELTRFEELGCLRPDWARMLKQLMEGPMRELLTARKAMLLKLGRHSGAEAVTIEGVRRIKIKQGNKQSTTKEHATTDWLTAEQKNTARNLVPFGWVLLEIDPQPEDSASQAIRHTLEAYTAATLSRQKQLLVAVQDTRHRLKAEQLRLSELKAEQERKRLEEERVEAEKAAARAALTDEVRAIQDLLQRMHNGEDKGRGAGSTLARYLAEMMEAATGWSDTDKTAAHTAALEIMAHLGIDRKNDKWKKRLNALKG